MRIDAVPKSPTHLAAIEADTRALQFGKGSDPSLGSLLRTLVASKPKGVFVELGTGTGIATSWILDGMDEESTLLTVDSDSTVVSVARKHLGHDSRVTFVVSDGATFLTQIEAEGRVFDLVFADAWPGKYSHLDEALRLVAPGGLYIVDDLLPQPNWPPGHQKKVDAFVDGLSNRSGFFVTRLDWATGVLVAARSS